MNQTKGCASVLRYLLKYISNRNGRWKFFLFFLTTLVMMLIRMILASGNYDLVAWRLERRRGVRGVSSPSVARGLLSSRTRHAFSQHYRIVNILAGVVTTPSLYRRCCHRRHPNSRFDYLLQQWALPQYWDQGRTFGLQIQPSAAFPLPEDDSWKYICWIFCLQRRMC